MENIFKLINKDEFLSLINDENLFQDVLFNSNKENQLTKLLNQVFKNKFQINLNNHDGFVNNLNFINDNLNEYEIMFINSICLNIIRKINKEKYSSEEVVKYIENGNFIFKNEIFVCNKCKKQISFEVRNWNNVNLIEEFQSENKSNTENLVKETELNYDFVKTPYYFSFKYIGLCE